MHSSFVKSRRYYKSSPTLPYKETTFVDTVKTQNGVVEIEFYILSPQNAYPLVTNEEVWQYTRNVSQAGSPWRLDWLFDAEDTNPLVICPLDLARWGMTSRRAWVKDSQGQILCHISAPPPANIRLPSSQPQSVRCECGADKCGSGLHSTWCPKYQART